MWIRYIYSKLKLSLFHPLGCACFDKNSLSDPDPKTQ
jgi:hypothetical protein